MRDSARKAKISLSSAKVYLEKEKITIRSNHKKSCELSHETEKEIIDLYEKRIGPTDIRKKLNLESYFAIYSCLRKNGVLRTRKNKRSEIGATTVTNEGYITEKVPDSWPFLGKMSGYGDGTWIAQHRLVMAEYLNRPLGPHEQVHHKNGNKKDNDITNLQLLGNHGSGQAFICKSCGSQDIEATSV